jgi:hypothetical protein
MHTHGDPSYRVEFEELDTDDEVDLDPKQRLVVPPKLKPGITGERNPLDGPNGVAGQPAGNAAGAAAAAAAAGPPPAAGGGAPFVVTIDSSAAAAGGGPAPGAGAAGAAAPAAAAGTPATPMAAEFGFRSFNRISLAN